MSFVQIKKYLQKNLYYVFIFSCFFLIFLYALIIHFDQEKYFTNGKTLYTVAEVINYESQGKGGNSVGYSFYYNNKYFVASNDKGVATEKSIYIKYRYDTEKMEKLLKGKKFFVKVSVEKPQYSRVYLSKPVAEDFQYVEGQTWEIIPKGAIENKDIYENYK